MGNNGLPVVVEVPARTVVTTRLQGSKRVRAGRTQSDPIIPRAHKATARWFPVIKSPFRGSRLLRVIVRLSIRARTRA